MSTIVRVTVRLTSEQRDALSASAADLSTGVRRLVTDHLGVGPVDLPTPGRFDAISPDDRAELGRKGGKMKAARKKSRRRKSVRP